MDALTKYNDEIKDEYRRKIAELEAENVRLKGTISGLTELMDQREEELSCVPEDYSVPEFVNYLREIIAKHHIKLAELRDAAAEYKNQINKWLDNDIVIDILDYDADVDYAERTLCHILDKTSHDK